MSGTKKNHSAPHARKVRDHSQHSFPAGAQDCRCGSKHTLSIPRVPALSVPHSRDFPEIQVSSAPTRCLESTFGAAACSA